jgi:hypothetical protein
LSQETEPHFRLGSGLWFTGNSDFKICSSMWPALYLNPDGMALYVRGTPTPNDTREAIRYAADSTAGRRLANATASAAIAFGGTVTWRANDKKT